MQKTKIKDVSISVENGMMLALRIYTLFKELRTSLNACKEYACLTAYFYLIFSFLQFSCLPDAFAQSRVSNSVFAESLSETLDEPLLPYSEAKIIQNAQRAQSLLTDKKFASSPLGKSLAQKVTRIQNYEIIKTGLSKCDDDQHTGQRLLALATRLNPNVPCGSLLKGDSLSRAGESVRLSILQDQVSKNSLLDSVNTAFDLEMKYGKGDPTHLVDNLCGGKCTGNDYEVMRGRLIDLEAKPKPRHLDTQREFFTLNRGMAKANTALSKIDVDTKYLVSAKISDANRVQYKAYTDEYMSTVAQPSGFLLATDTLQEYFGKYRDLNSDLKRGVTSFAFDLHHISNNGDGRENGDYGPKIVMQQAIREAQKRTIEQAQEIAQQDSKKYHEEQIGNRHSYRNGEESAEDLTYLLDTNPPAFAQALMDHPEETADVCNIIGKAQVARKHKAVVHKIAMGAVIALAIAAAAFGGFALIAGVFYGASVTGALLVAATVATVGGAVSTADRGVAYFQTRNEMLRLQTSILSKTNSPEAIAQYNDALTKMSDVGNEAVLSGIMTVAGIASVTAAREAFLVAQAGRELTAAEEIAQLKGTSKVLEEINAANKVDHGVSEALAQMTKTTGEQETAELVADMASMDTKTQEQVLKRLSQIRNDPEKLRELHDVAEEAGANCRN